MVRRKGLPCPAPQQGVHSLAWSRPSLSRGPTTWNIQVWLHSLSECQVSLPPNDTLLLSGNCDKPYAPIHWLLNLLERCVVCGSHVFLPDQRCPQHVQPGPPSALAFLYQKLKSLSQPLLLRLPCYNTLAHAHHCSGVWHLITLSMILSGSKQNAQAHCWSMRQLHRFTVILETTNDKFTPFTNSSNPHSNPRR